jgi:hypothetical protein
MRRTLLAAALAAASLVVFAQPYGPAQGQGPGYGPGYGHGPGMRGGGCCGAEATPAWALMTEEERAQHQEKMRGMNDYAQCQAYMAEHHKLMQERAKELGRSLPSAGPGPGCQWLRKPA